MAPYYDPAMTGTGYYNDPSMYTYNDAPGTNEPYYNPVDSASHTDIYSATNTQTVIDFFSRLQAHFTEYKVAHSNDMSGYFGTQQTTQFSFTYEGQPVSGSIVYTPIADTDTSTGGNQNYHNHDGQSMIHLQNVDVYTAPGGYGAIVAEPSEGTTGNILEVAVTPP